MPAPVDRARAAPAVVGRSRGVPADGRRARGERRRRAILAATLRVIEREGVSGVSHRSVAREAEVPVSSTVYYYSTLDDLLIACLKWSASEMAVAFGSVSPTPSSVARFLADAVGPHRGRTLAEYELYLFAARRPELRPAARRWITLLSSVFGTMEPAAFLGFVAALDGLLIQGLIADFPPTAEQLEPVVSLLMPLR
ncbi:TetR family transcriptional regulator [Saccharothrix mutabilis subsp. mutabilis]|uniref:TetR family transcriptional regulator n=1 Tax=Saccharothrix mutabilis subsp. mutabilis TaxID=66855 RepID=A0ABP3D9K7_9PSEU